MMEKLTINPCSRSPPEPLPYESNEKNAQAYKVTNNCAEVLAANYIIDFDKEQGAIYAGVGELASVILLMDRKSEKRVAVKLFPFLLRDNLAQKHPARARIYQNQVVRNASEEVLVACKLNELKTKTWVFIQTFGWLICNSYPKSWDKFPDFDFGKKEAFKKCSIASYMYLFMEHADYTFGAVATKFNVLRQDWITFLFLLTHGLWVARKAYGFTHGDLHGGNIMFSLHRPSEAKIEDYQVVEILGKSFRVALPFMLSPKIIDFGNSATLEIVKEGFSGRTNDMHSMIYMGFKKLVRDFSTEDDYDRWFDMGLFKEDNVAAMERFLLEDRIFNELRSASVPLVGARIGIRLACSFCGRAARERWDTIETLQFCNSFCAGRVSGLAIIGIATE